jgi:collagenase-like PrtC family protease
MKIMAPLRPSFSVEILSNAGADGFYLGYIPTKWIDLFGNGNLLNRRGHISKINFLQSNIVNVIQECHKYGKCAYVVFNNHQYTNQEFDCVADAILFLSKHDIDGIITSDINVIKHCKANKISSHLSTCATNYNRFSCEFYKCLGVGRIILARDIELTEMSQMISSVSNMEWEAFIYNSACRFSESVCLSNHGLYGNVCKRLKNESQLLIREGTAEEYAEKYNYCTIRSCGLCEIYSLNAIGVNWLKIVERSLPFKSIFESCQKVKRAIFLIDECKNDACFRERIKIIEFCNDNRQCYYR